MLFPGDGISEAIIFTHERNIVPAAIKISFVVNSLGMGGAERHVISLASNLDRRFFDSQVIYLKTEAKLLPDLQQGSIPATCADVRRKVDLAAIRRIAAQWDDSATDVVLATNQYSSLYALLARFFSLRKPRLISVFHSSRCIGNRRGDRLKGWFYRMAVSRFDLLVYVSERQREYWEARGFKARRSVVIHNGIDTIRYRDGAVFAMRRGLLGFCEADYVVGLSAALRPEKRITDLVDAVALLQARGLPARLLIIGDGSERPRIEGRIAEKLLPHTAVITGYLSDVRPYVSCCDVMTLVSETETFSIAVLESMSMGKAMVVSNVGGASEQITPDETGCLFQAGNVAQLADYLGHLYDEATRKRLGRQARVRVEANFSLERMMLRYQEEVLACHRG